MVKISIISLIYKSPDLADWVYNSAMKYTPMLANGEAEFLFVANDPTDALVKHLSDRQYPFVINKNKSLTNDELFSLGFGIPEYMHRVYRGYNTGILQAKGERVVLVNSDNFFSPDWIENLLKYSTFDRVVCSQLVEPGHEKFSFFPTALRANFGKTTATFEEDNFIRYVMREKSTGLRYGGAYMPCMLFRDVALYAGLYPEGNIAGENFDTVVRYGDESFYDRLSSLGVKHYTSSDSIVYHLKEGERDDDNDDSYTLDEEIKEKFTLKEYTAPRTVDLKEVNVHLGGSTTFTEILPCLVDNKTLPTAEKITLLEEKLASTQAELAAMQRILSHPLIRAQRKLWRILRFWK